MGRTLTNSRDPSLWAEAVLDGVTVVAGELFWADVLTLLTSFSLSEIDESDVK